MDSLDHELRVAAFKWLAGQVEQFGEVLPRTVLVAGFQFHDLRVPLQSPQGIFKPQILSDIPLSITTAPLGPYDDSFSPDGLLRYRYRGTNPQHKDNVGLRLAMQRRIPLVYFHGINPGKYLAVWPVFIVGDSPATLTFTVSVDDVSTVRIVPGQEPTQELPDDPGVTGRRAYITRLTQVRLHQQSFRERVIDAYREQCACCRLRHIQLLDAAHIVPDSDPEGEPIVPNGISLCKLHHAAFDSFIIGITPDFVVRVRKDILCEIDGPMLKHGLQGMDGTTITLPHSKKLLPDRGLLEKRFEIFKRAG